MAVNIRFQVLPEELENRFRAAFNALKEGDLTDVQATKFFFKYFFQRLEPMYRDKPKVAQVIQDAVKNQIVGFIVHPNIVDVTLNIETISDLHFSKGVALKNPALIFDKLEDVIGIILTYISIPEALVKKKIQVRKMGKILRWLAPITTIQTEETVQRVREEDLAIFDRLLQEMGY